MDFLSEFYEIRNHGDIINWAVKLLHDLTKAEEIGFHMALIKSEIEDGKVSIDPDCQMVHFKMEWLAPSDKGFCRIPLDNLKKISEK